METRLPKYQPLFEREAQKVGLDWRLLAAIGYQESHWRPNAVSPTGVRGLMMLTQATANQLGVKDRTNPRESIYGGAQYLKQRLKIDPPRPNPRKISVTFIIFSLSFVIIMLL